jgi:hypothetical protein
MLSILQEGLDDERAIAATFAVVIARSGGPENRQRWCAFRGRRGAQVSCIGSRRTISSLAPASARPHRGTSAHRK